MSLSIPYTQDLFAEKEHRVIRRALRLIERRLREPGPTISDSVVAHQLFVLRMAGLGREVFDVAFLDAKHRLIEVERMFMGGLDGAQVNAREIVRRAMFHNAAAILVAHNHPSGVADPSFQDQLITRRLRETLALVDIKLLDHIVVGGTDTNSVEA